jgi:hypothetical protein
MVRSENHSEEQGAAKLVDGGNTNRPSGIQQVISFDGHC